jgi:hypothetical protein
MFNRDDISWEDVGFMLDCSQAALGDIGFLEDDGWLGDSQPCLRTDDGGYGMLYADASCDGLPVEIGTVDGCIVAARLEFTYDVDELDSAGEGCWVSRGSLRIGDEGAVALDKKHQHVEGWTHRIALAPGRYDAEIFDWEGDCLGIRLVAAIQNS